MVKHLILLLAIAVVIISSSVAAYSREIPFTQEDRDRLIRLEAKLEEGLKSTNQRIEEGLKSTNQRIEEGLKSTNQRIEEGLKSTNRRIDDLRDEIKDIKIFMLWGFGILFGGMGILIGFVIWDRRTALAPAIKKSKELEEREEKVERVLKKFARKEPELAEALREEGLLQR